MELVPFTPIFRRISESGQIELPISEGTAFSLPVAVRRYPALYDALFFFKRPAEGSDRGPRPFAWALIDASSGEIAQFSRCDFIDFMPPGSLAVGEELPMTLPALGMGKKRETLLAKLYAAYEEIRPFAFNEHFTRSQAAAVTTYKDIFQRVTYPAHYPYYHALSPAFFHWLRMPLPKEALMGPARQLNALQTDGYQLLILENLQQLVRQFQEKIATDQHKEQLFDEMHRELQSHKNDLLESLTLPMERDVIQIIDSIAKSVEACRSCEDSAESNTRLFALLEGVGTDLTDLLYRQGVEPFTLEGLDLSRQKIVQTTPTNNSALDKTISARIGSGWEKAGRVIRPERISVYVYSAQNCPKGD